MVRREGDGSPKFRRRVAEPPLFGVLFGFVRRFRYQKSAIRHMLVYVPYGPAWRCIYLAEVRVQEGEPLENALRRFKRKVQTEDIIKEVKRHSFYLKPGEKKRVKEALARKRNRKKVRKEQE